MATRVGINGFGRIGRIMLRLFDREDDFECVAMNARGDAKTYAHLFKYDSVFGKFGGDIVVGDGEFTVNGTTVKVLKCADPAELPWGDLGIEYVMETTGVYRTREPLEAQLKNGVKKILLSAPARDAIDATIVIGANDEVLKPEHTVVSNASCTTNCLAPLAKVILENFGIKRGMMTTVHAYTGDQTTVDRRHKDLRRARAAANSVIPTTTGAAKAVGQVIPELAGKLDGMALRVPVIDGSITDLTVEIEKNATDGDINAAVKAASETEKLQRIIEYCDEPIVSCDVIGNRHSCVFDALSTKVMGDNMVKVLAWYDNEWGYAERCLDVMRMMVNM